MKFNAGVSGQRRKSRCAHFSAPSHIKYTLMSAPLSEELQKEHGIQSLPVRRDDVVEILRGSNQGSQGKINMVYRKKWCLYIEKVQKQSKKGGIIKVPVQASNVRIIKPFLTEDRKALIKRKREGRGLGKGKYTQGEVSAN